MGIFIYPREKDRARDQCVPNKAQRAWSPGGGSFQVVVSGAKAIKMDIAYLEQMVECKQMTWSVQNCPTPILIFINCIRKRDLFVGKGRINRLEEK